VFDLTVAGFACLVRFEFNTLFEANVFLAVGLTRSSLQQLKSVKTVLPINSRVPKLKKIAK